MSDNISDEFTKLLKSATGEIDSTYFKLSEDGRPWVFRERVYCYELYHQLRIAIADSFLAETDYVLNGEVDKSGHHHFQEKGLLRLKPDLLLHCPGTMNGNHTVVEVKPANYRVVGLHKDLVTLHRLHKMPKGYRRQVLLVYGSIANLSTLKQDIVNYRATHSLNSPLELWHHRCPGSDAECIAMWDNSLAN